MEQEVGLYYCLSNFIQQICVTYPHLEPNIKVDEKKCPICNTGNKNLKEIINQLYSVQLKGQYIEWIIHRIVKLQK